MLTVESGVHSANVDQQTYHGHTLRGLSITKQLVAQDFAGLAASRHGIDVQIGKGLLAEVVGFVAVGEDLSLVVEDGLEEIKLDILAPEGLAVFLLQVSDLSIHRCAALVRGMATALASPGAALGGLWGCVAHLGILILCDVGHE